MRPDRSSSRLPRPRPVQVVGENGEGSVLLWGWVDLGSLKKIEISYAGARERVTLGYVNLA